MGSSERPFELLESKLLLPRRANSVPRTELVGRMDGSTATPVVLVCAGPGWGKTTLLAEWAASAERPFAWVDIDERDNDPIVLLTYVATALDRLSPIDPAVFDALSTPGISVEGTLVPRLGAALVNASDRFVLVLEDLHRIDNPSCLDSIAMLIRHIPAGSHIALSSRREPALSLGALRAHGLTFEVGQDELQLEDEEAAVLLTAAGVALPDDAVADLTRETEGWSAGLYLAALSIRARGEKVADPVARWGSPRLVSDYLRSELLAHLSADELAFLVRTAVLERLCGPLCDALLETHGSAKVLDALARSNLFLIPLDGSGDWFRYHPLFRELLLSELARSGPDLVTLLLARATDWCEANGRPGDAIEYARAAGDADRVADFVVRYGLIVYRSGRAATVERWLRWLDSNGAIERQAAVAILASMLAAVQGRPVDSDRWAAMAERASQELPLPDGSASVDGWRSLLLAMRAQEGPGRMRLDADAAVEQLGLGNPFWPLALLLRASSSWIAGERDEGDDLLHEVVDAGLELDAPESLAVALGVRGAIAIARNEWVEAHELSARALRVLTRARMHEYPTSAFSYAVAARSALHRGELEHGQELLARAQRLRRKLTYALPWLAVPVRLELGRAYLAVADAGGARTMLREVDALMRRLPDLGALRAELEELRGSLATIRANAPGASTLTAAELRVIPYLATHLTFREIGKRLYISHHTVKSQAMAVYRKLNVTSRNGAVERAMELGLV